MTTSTKPGPGGGGNVFTEAAANVKRLRYVAQDALRAVKELERDTLGRYTIPAGAVLDEREVIDFLRLAIEDTNQEVTLLVIGHVPERS